jgi:outer membrane protein insertion porin family
MPIFEQFLWLDGFFDAAALQTQGGLVNMNGTASSPYVPYADSAQPDFTSLGWRNMAMSMGFGFRFAIQQFPFRFYFAKRFVFDGSNINWKTTNGLDLVISITQALN